MPHLSDLTPSLSGVCAPVGCWFQEGHLSYCQVRSQVEVIQLEQRITGADCLAYRDEDLGHNPGDRRPHGDVLGVLASIMPAPATNDANGACDGWATGGGAGIGWPLVATVQSAKTTPATANNGSTYVRIMPPLRNSGRRRMSRGRNLTSEVPVHVRLQLSRRARSSRYAHRPSWQYDRRTRRSAHHVLLPPALARFPSCGAAIP
jgi:hypothetical protein